MRKRREERILAAFGKSVKKRRLELHLSQEKLAELADLHRTYISDIERGARNVGLINIVRVANALEIPAADLLMELRGHDT